MKKIKCFVAIASIMGFLTSCNDNKINMTFENTYTFESTLEEEQALYPSSKGRIFYVSTSGVEGNDGLSEDNPLPSIDQVNKLSLLPGDSVLFKKGDIFNGKLSFKSLNGDDDNPITFASYGEGEMPVLTNGNSTSSAVIVYIQQSNNIVIRDLDIQVCAGNRKKGASLNQGINIVYRDSGNNKYRNIYICNNKVHGVLPLDADFKEIDTNVMGIVLSSQEANYNVSKPEVVSNVIIDGNEVYNIGRTGIYTTANNYQNSGENAHDVHYDKFLNVHIDHNYVHHVGTIGMYIKSGSYSTMNYNVIHDTGVSTDSTVVEGETGMMYICAAHCEAKFNHVYRVFDQNTGYDAMGIDIDWNTYDIDIAYNYCHDCQGSGIGTMATNTSYIRNNRIENNMGETSHNGSIVVSNFIPPVAITGLTEEWLSVDNLHIEDNLVIHDKDDKFLFRHKADNGRKTYKGNTFNRNHCVFNGDDPEEFQWFAIDEPWSQFNENKFYSLNTSKFKSMDMTPVEDVENADKGAVPYTLTRERSFSEWQKRDIGATYELINNEEPSKIYNPIAKYEDGKIKLSWKSQKNDAWHYNIYEIKNEEEELEYTNMIGESFENNFEITPKFSGKHIYAIQSESHQGIFGNVLLVTINL